MVQKLNFSQLQLRRQAPMPSLAPACTAEIQPTARKAKCTGALAQPPMLWSVQQMFRARATMKGWQTLILPGPM